MMKMMGLILLAALVFLPGCSGEKKNKPVLKEANAQETVFKGRIVCPSCRAALAEGDMKFLNQQTVQCLKCKKAAPRIRFYPDAKKTR